MKSHQTIKYFTPKSLWGKLNLYSSVLVMVTVISGILLFSCLTSRIQQRERAESIKTLAATLARLVARPVSQGDYLLAENYINGDGFPGFIEFIKVRDRAGHVVAGRTKENSQIIKNCGQSTSFRQPIFDPVSVPLGLEAPEATIEIVASNCDIVKAQQEFGLTSLGFGALVFLILLLVNRVSINYLLLPLSRTVKLGIKRGRLEESVIHNSPIEIQPLLIQLKELYQEVSESEAQSRVGEFAAQVAHDIRSPLAALDSIVRELGELREESRLVISSALSRIRDIANCLIEQNREAQAQSAMAKDPEMRTIPLLTESSVQLLSSLVEPLITEKRLQYRAHIYVVIEGSTNESSYGLFSKINPVEFKRLLSNLIDNAVESIAENGHVSVSIAKHDAQSICLSVTDNGKGIASDILPKLMQKGSTFGKQNGSGLGLYSAKKIAESWNGRLEIHSEVGQGTTANVVLPLTTPPPWFVEKLMLQPNSTVVVLDDDATIHQVWQGRLEALKISYPENNLNVVHLSTPEEFTGWVTTHQPSDASVVYLVDFELRTNGKTGLDLIADLDIVRDSILVTSRFEDASVLERIHALNLRLIPKGMAGFVPLDFNIKVYDAVLIDNDPLNHLVWEMSARRHGIRLKVFDRAPNVCELICYGLETPIYIDSDLGNGVRGEQVAKSYAEEGLKNLSLTTGLSAEYFASMSWLTHVYGKSPPWDSSLA